MHTSLGSIDAEARRLSSEEFAETFRFPFLLHEERQSEIEYQGPQTMGIAYMPTCTDPREADAWIPYELKGREQAPQFVSLGRSAANSIVLDDPSVSQRHALLAVRPDQKTLLVTDLGSTNGTAYGGSRIPAHTAVEVKSGQIVTFGRVPLRYVSVEELQLYLKALREHGKL